MQNEDIELDAKIGKWLGLDVVGKGEWTDWGEGAHVCPSFEKGHYETYLYVDRPCHCEINEEHASEIKEGSKLKNMSEPEDWIHGHHRWCLQPVPYYSSFYCGDKVGQLLEILKEKNIPTQVTIENGKFQVLIMTEIGFFKSEGEKLPLVLCQTISRYIDGLVKE